MRRPPLEKRVRALEIQSTAVTARPQRSEEHTSELQSPCNLVCRLLLEKKKKTVNIQPRDRKNTPLNLTQIENSYYTSCFSSNSRYKSNLRYHVLRPRCNKLIINATSTT